MNVDFDQQDIIIELAPEGKDGRSVHPAGEWSADAEYHSLDIVSYQGSSYMATRIVPAGTLPTDAEYWQIVAEKGEPGASEWGEISGNIADQTDLQDALDSKADVGTSYTKAEEDALLAQKADASAVYTKTETDSLLADKADVGDSYTKAEEEALLAVKANSADVYTKTETDTLLLDKAPVILSSASGSIASFSDGSPAPVTALTVGIDPVQDLHGQDAPYPAGGGKNLINPDTLINGYYNDSGAFVSLASYRTTPLIPVSPSTTYSGSLFDKSKTRISALVFTFWDANGTFISQASVAVSVTTTAETAYVRIRTLQAQTSYIENDNFLLYAEQGSSSNTFSPYSNICPISGHTSATVTRTGKNLLEVASGYTHTEGGITMTTNADGTFTLNGTATKTFIGMFNLSYANSSINNQNDAKKYIPAGTYKLSDLGSRLRLQIYGSNSAIVTSANAVKIGDFTDTIVTIDDTYSFTYARLIILSGAVFNNETFYPWIYKVDENDTYEPYQGQTVTIDLDGTRYGGVIDVPTGTMTVDREYVEFDGSVDEDWKLHNTVSSWFYIDAFADNVYKDNAKHDFAISNKYLQANYSNATSMTNGQFGIGGTDYNRLAIKEKSASTVPEFVALLANSPVELVYKLATPFTVTLTPSQIQTLLGENHIWADTGDVAVEYRADTKLYIDGVTSATTKVTRQMIADSAIDGKAPKSLATGDLIIVGDELRKATANIGNGSAITASNSTIATLADVIKALQ